MAIKSNYEMQMANLGKAIHLLHRTKRRSFSIASAFVWLTPPIRLGQIAYQENARGEWSAYVTWAFLSQDVSDNMLLDPPMIQISDWNEGDNLWIIDAVGLPGAVTALANRVRRSFSATHLSVRYLKRRASGQIDGVRQLRICRFDK